MAHHGSHGQPRGHHQGGVGGNAGRGCNGDLVGGGVAPLLFRAKLFFGWLSTTMTGATHPALNRARLLVEIRSGVIP